MCARIVLCLSPCWTQYVQVRETLGALMNLLLWLAQPIHLSLCSDVGA